MDIVIFGRVFPRNQRRACSKISPAFEPMVRYEMKYHYQLSMFKLTLCGTLRLSSLRIWLIPDPVENVYGDPQDTSKDFEIQELSASSQHPAIDDSHTSWRPQQLYGQPSEVFSSPTDHSSSRRPSSCPRWSPLINRPPLSQAQPRICTHEI